METRFTRASRTCAIGCGCLTVALTILSAIMVAVVLSSRHRRHVQQRVSVGNPPSDQRIYVDNPPVEHWPPQHPDDATHVPFRIEGWEIVVDATVSGRPMACILDTGCNNLTWDAALELPCRKTGLSREIPDIRGNRAKADWIVLPSVRLRTFEVTNVPSMAVPAAQYANTEYVSEAVRRHPILGTALFRNCELTIDYPKSELVIRRSRVVAPRSGGEPQDARFIDFYANGGSNLIFIRGSLSGVPMEFALDTGCALPLVIGQKAASSLPSNVRFDAAPGYDRTNGGKPQRRVARKLACSFLGEKAKSDVIVDPTFPFNIVGYPILRHYCIAIDYPNHTVRFTADRRLRPTGGESKP